MPAYEKRASKLRPSTRAALPPLKKWARRALRSGIALVLVLGGSISPAAVTGEVQARPYEPFGSQDGSGPLYLPIVASQASIGGPELTDAWPTVAANPERTSANSVAVSGQVHPVWYRPIQAYIPENVQVIASDGLLFISTARGLYALNALNGSVAWRFDTELPLGNSPTVFNHVVYVGGFDHKIHALDARTGTQLWAFDGATAGYSANPLVVNGLVITGNRDGWMYAVGAQGTASAGSLVWKYRAGGPIEISAAYKDGTVYFAAMDNYAYALNASSGSLVWRSALLPGDGFESYWATIYQNEVIFSGSSPYRDNKNPGTKSIKDSGGNTYVSYDAMQRDDVFDNLTQLGPTVTDTGAWAHGKPVIDAGRALQYLENNPNPDPHLHKPWRRNLIVLNRSDGSEYTLKASDGYPSYAPYLWYGTHSGNAYPAIVGADGILYRSNPYLYGGIPQGMVMGWNFGTTHMSIMGLQGADDEPQALSAGGSVIYRSICCDRVGDWVDTATGQTGAAWGYAPFDLPTLVPGYDAMWWGKDPNGLPDLVGNYGTNNGVYHSHGDQNPIIPYMGMLFIHRSNAIIAFGTGQGPGKLPLLTSAPATDNPTVPTASDLKSRLENEIQKIVSAGHLRPGYYNSGQWGFADSEHLPDYFANPGDTLLALSQAYPYLSAGLQGQVKTYLQTEFNTYFYPTPYSQMGWKDGAAREWMPMAPEVQNAINASQKVDTAGDNWSWRYPPLNIYALWLYSQNVAPENTDKSYTQAKQVLLQVPVPVTNDYFVQWPYELNAWIGGYYGFLQLQTLDGKASQDASLRQSVTNEFNRLESLRATAFTKDTYWVNPTNSNLPIDGGPYHYRALNVAQNFIFMTPELGTYLNQNALSKVQAAVTEYNSVAPYWFVSRFNAAVDEGARQQLYDTYAVFLARAYILKQSQKELAKYLDVPAFARGDLLYIQNLIAALGAP